ncbi:MAG: energy-coupling factor transport system permease/ATP-binding protein, partial [Actinomycetota bacterium]|nr:energy-coupling factor transport system permease/ATP-binding protein [Actinomycetota bacterium]
ITSALGASGATLVMVQHQLSDWLDEVDRLVVLDSAGRVSVDGPAAATLAGSADSLAAQGVWVPGVWAPRPLEVSPELCTPTLSGGSGRVLVSAESVSVIRRPRVSVMSANRPAAAVQALLEVCAEVRAGECIAVVGPSGAGKSTLTALLAGVQAPTYGRVHSCLPPQPQAQALHRWTSRSLAARFGWVPQQAAQAVVGRTVRGDVLSTSRRLGLNDEDAQTRVDGLLDVLGLSGMSAADPHHLSGGEQRRLALAGAIAHGPSVLVLDEPSVGQDRLTWSAVAGVVAAARDAGVGVVLATHDPLLIALADRRITLLAGQIVEPALEPEVEPALEPPLEPEVEPRWTAQDGRRRREPHPRDGPSTMSVPSGRFVGLAGRSGPLSLLLASIVLILGVPFISDLRTALIACGVEIALAPVVLGVGRFPWRRLLPGLFAVASVSFSNWLLSPGREWSTGGLAGLRIAFFVLPGLLLASRIDPSALGDHCGQRLGLPARPVVAAVAALHRFEGLGEHWDQLARIRRVRGLGPGRSPLDRGRSVAALTFGLLIETLRQAGRMAVAMEARGFSPAGSSASRRTWAEPAPWRPADSLMLALGLAVAVIPLLLFRF